MTHTRTWLAAHVADLRLSGASLAPEAAPEAVDRRVDDPRNDAGAAGSGRTVASWYDQRPFACFDDEGRHDLPRGIGIWVAHRTLPCGTPVLVIAGDRSVVAHVWDHGPFVEGRALDLSKRAFALLAPPSRGVIEVRWRVLGSA